MPKSSDGGGWRAALDRGVGNPAPPSAGAPTGTDLALLFQMRTLSREGSQWTAPRAEPATSVGRAGTQRLAVRPVIRSAKGNWVTNEVTWSSLSYVVERLRLDPRQVAWFTQFAALHRASGEGFRATEADWLYLDDFASPLLWPLLRSAADIGIVLATGKQSARIELLPDATITIEIGRDGSSAGLRVTPVLTVEGIPFHPTGTIGDHGIYASRFDPDLRVMLAPASADAVEAVSWPDRALRVPVDEVDEFWEDYFPVLSRRTYVSGVGVPLPDITTQVVLVVEYEPNDVISTRWENWTGTLREPVAEPPLSVPLRMEGSDAADFVMRDLEGIIASGVRVVERGDRPDYTESTDEPRVELIAVPTGKNDWFEFGFVIKIDPWIIPFADIFTAFSKNRDKLLMVDRKTWVSLNRPVFDALRNLIEEGTQLREWETGLILTRYEAAMLEPFRDESDRTPGAIAWRETARGLSDPPAPIAAPRGLTATLRPYQVEGYRWLTHLHEHGLGGILADDMGLGKTVQAIALIQHTIERRGRDAHPFLVVAPTSVVGTWADELARFAPQVRVGIVGSTRDALPDDVDVIITSYALFRLEYERFARITWESLILDEAQFVKNPAAQIHECALNLPARTKFALTGTPLENGLMDLWAILRIVSPGLYPSRLRFADRYVKAHSKKRIAELRRRIRPLMLRRTKQAVATDLPPKQEQTVTIDLAPAHRALYDRYFQRERQKVMGLVQDLDRNRFIVFRSLTLLRLLALDPRLITTDLDAEDDSGTATDGEPIPSTKLDELIERIVDLADEGHRALVFSQFTGYLGLVRERLNARGIPFEYLDGSTTKRPAVIARFRDGDAPVFLISLRAGGTGLTLTEADYVFLLDPWWNPAAENQAIDRTHRIGQHNPVMVYRLVARDTIEEKVLALAERKSALFDEVVDAGSLFSENLTADDIRGLLN